MRGLGNTGLLVALLATTAWANPALAAEAKRESAGTLKDGTAI